MFSSSYHIACIAPESQYENPLPEESNQWEYTHEMRNTKKKKKNNYIWVSTNQTESSSDKQGC